LQSLIIFANDTRMIDDLSSYLNQTLLIGNKTIKKRLVLAPMTLLGHVAFRELVASFGGYGLLFSEMCSAKRIPHENRLISPYFRWRDDERGLLVCQIFGADPKIMATAAQKIEEFGFFGVDINFGCAVSSICRQNCGAALLKDPNLAARIVAGVRKAVSFPLFVKFRTGWKDDPQVAVNLARRFEDAGADALTFHPRVAPDRRSRPPRWGYIKMVKQAVSLPVFGNGNVFSRSDCLNMLQSTGSDGVAIGRLAIAKPWIFKTLTDGYQIIPGVYLDAALRLTKLLVKHYEPVAALKRFKKFAQYYSANFRYGQTLFNRIRNLQSMDQAEQILYKFFEVAPELVSRPNMNLLQ
jgi:nifR3 family TIM-barrel protein